MRKTVSNTLLLLALVLGTMTGVVSAQEDGNEPPALVPGDGNEPPELADVLLPFVEDIVWNEMETPPELVVMTGAQFVDANHIIGFYPDAIDVIVLDQDGAELYNTVGQESALDRLYYSPKLNVRAKGVWDRYWTPISFPLGSLSSLTSLSTVEWTVAGLMAEEIVTVDVPFEPNDTAVELIPGFQILVEDAYVIEEGDFEYMLQIVYDPNLMAYDTGQMWFFFDNEVLPEILVTELELLNAAGESMRDVCTAHHWHTHGSTRMNDDGLMVSTVTAEGWFYPADDVTTIRYTFAYGPYESMARLVLENVEMPSEEEEQEELSEP